MATNLRQQPDRPVRRRDGDMSVTTSAAHGEKLQALLANRKLPPADVPRVRKAVERYTAWQAALDGLSDTGPELLPKMVALLSDYKRYIELELIFDSPDDFLYRQKGQTKIDNTVLEEFLPRLFDARLVPGLAKFTSGVCGPQKAFAGLSFGTAHAALETGGVFIKKKDQDFAVAKPYTLTIVDPSLGEKASFSDEIHVAYFASEIKTNLDKTMFQEASATARELKQAVPQAKYILLCEWLDMPPIDTHLTAIDEVILLREARRLASNVRESFSTAAGRKAARARYSSYLDENPLRAESFERFLYQLNVTFPESLESDEGTILQRGYF